MPPPSSSPLHLKPSSWCCVAILSLLLLGIAAGTSFSSTQLRHDVPSFTLQELQTGQRSGELKHVLGTTGLLSVQLPSPRSSSYRSVALEGLCHCLQDEVLLQSGGRGLSRHSNIQQTVLDDDWTVRTTLGTATVGMETPLPLMNNKKNQDAALQEACGSSVVHAMEDLREDVALASRAFVESLDRLLNNIPQEPLLHDAHGKTYSSVAQIVQSANHLEHFHSYSKKAPAAPAGPLEGGDDDSRLTLDWHTDAGLFLAFVPAWNCHSPHGEQQEDASFWIQDDATGTARRAVFAPSANVVIMLGVGAQHWLHLKNSPSPLQLRATRHAVHLQAGAERTWYGMMHLVPESAIISPPSSSHKYTFGEMKKSLVLSTSGHAQEDAPGVKSISLGCGTETPSPRVVVVSEDDASLDALTGRRRRLQPVEDGSACNNSTNFFCWMRCQEIPEVNELDALKQQGRSLYCVDPGLLGQGIEKAVEPCVSAHNSNCIGWWAETLLGVAASIRGAYIEPSANKTVSPSVLDEDEPFCYGGTSMYMDGFHWVHETTCVIYLFPEWVLSKRWHLVVASLGTIVAGIVMEYIIFERRQILGATEAGLRRLAMSGLIYGMQLTMGYLLMLVVMTYSGVLFFCTIWGIVGGHVLFNSQDALLRPLLTSSSNQKKELTEEKGDDITDDGRNCSRHCESHDSQSKEESAKDKAVADCVPEGFTPCCQNNL